MITLLASAIADIAHSVRRLCRTPIVFILLSLLLAGAISLTTIIFSVVNALLLRPMPYRDSQRLVLLGAKRRESDISFPVSPAEFWDWRESGVFEDMAALANTHAGLLSYGPSGGSRLVHVTVSTSNLFDVLGIRPLWGPGFVRAEETRPDNVVMLSYSFATETLGQQSEVVGGFIRLDGAQYRVAGVLPPDFHFYTNTDVWKLIAPAREDRSRRSLSVIAKLPPTSSAAKVHSQMDGVAQHLERAFPATNKGFTGVVITPLRDRFVYSVRQNLQMLSVVALLFLALVCGALISMQIARSEAQQKAVAIRASIGADKWQLTSYLLSDSILCAFVGCGSGLVISNWGLRLLRQGTLSLPRSTEIHLDMQSLAFFSVVTALTLVLCALIPAVKNSKVDLATVLKGGSNSTTPSWRLAGALGVLVVLQTSMALVAASNMAAVIRSLVKLHRIDPGFRTENIATLGFKVPADRFPEPYAESGVLGNLITEIGTIPGVQHIGAINSLPLLGQAHNFPFTINGIFVPATTTVQYRFITPDYFETMSVPLLRGRGFAATDNRTSKAVCIINMAMARQYWPRSTGLGASIKFPNTLIPGAPWMQVVGVVGDVRQIQLTEPASPEVDIPVFQYPGVSEMDVVIKSTGNFGQLSSDVNNAVRRTNAGLPNSDLALLTNRLSRLTSTTRFVTSLVSCYAMLCLFLAAASTYAIISFGISRRVRDIALRIALGATHIDISILIMKQGCKLGAVGICLGLLSTFAVNRLLSNRFASLSPLSIRDVLFSIACVCFSVAIACYIPAIRAARIDPIDALRAE
jgi:putative ABC transport system permease protein